MNLERKRNKREMRSWAIARACASPKSTLHSWQWSETVNTSGYKRFLLFFYLNEHRCSNQCITLIESCVDFCVFACVCVHVWPFNIMPAEGNSQQFYLFWKVVHVPWTVYMCNIIMARSVFLCAYFFQKQCFLIFCAWCFSNRNITVRTSALLDQTTH